MNEILLKILMIGDSDVGKTRLLFKFTGDCYSQTTIYTLGVEWKEKTIKIKNFEVRLQIWDTHRQERFRSIPESFFRGAHGIIFVFDITNKDSFDLLYNFIIDSKNCQNIKKILVGNRLELEEKRKVKKEKAEKLANKYGMKYIEASDKNGTNVDLIFNEIANMILANKSEEEIINEFGFGNTKKINRKFNKLNKYLLY